jgi:penicillin-binding protein A
VTAQIRRMGIVMIALFVALFAKLNVIQVLQADSLANDTRNTRAAVRDFSKPRGAIQAADGTVLAQSVPSNDAFERQRQYPEGALFGHVTGYFSFTYGSEGIERAYNDELAGRDLPIRQLGDVLSDRTRTGTVTLHLTKAVQQVARDALGDRKGAVVALDPTTGAVRALWSFPSYDPAPLAGHNQQQVAEAWKALNADEGRPLLPRTYRSRYFPGSTFKVVTATAAVERKPDLAQKTYPSLSALDLPRTDRDLKNFGGSTCGGVLPALLQRSCNTGFAALGLDMGAEAMAAEAGDFGFGSRPPVDMPAPAVSVFQKAETFDRNEPLLAFASIGQGDVSATPLQMALVASGIANRGVIMKPRLAAHIRDSEGEIVRNIDPEPWRTVTSPEVADAVKAMMVSVVQSGTGTRARIPGVTVAGKTGTAQTTGNNAHAWFVGFAPAEAPTVAVAVIVEQQPGLGDTVTGGRVAAPIAQAVMKAVLGL